MSTIKSADEHLTLNADGTSKNILFQADGVQKASISSAGLFTSTTIDATVLTGNLPAISGASLTGVGGDISFGGDTFGADKTIGANDAYALSFETSGNVAMKIDSAGIITKPLQPAFIAYKSGDQSNLGTGDTTITWETEILDTNADFASNTFTAPVDGLYHFNFNLTLGNLDVSITYFNCILNTSNRVYRNTQSDFSKDYTADTNEYNGMNNGVNAYMDAGDTAIVQVNIGGSGSQIDIIAGSSGNVSSVFSGYLVA